jgi:hypothetical protein
LDSDRLSGVSPLQVQTQDRYRGIKCLDDMQGLDLNCRFKFVEELLDTGERRAWHKRAVEEVLFLPCDPHLANLPLLDIHEIDDLSNIS